MTAAQPERVSDGDLIEWAENRDGLIGPTYQVLARELRSRRARDAGDARALAVVEAVRFAPVHNDDDGSRRVYLTAHGARVVDEYVAMARRETGACGGPPNAPAGHCNVWLHLGDRDMDDRRCGKPLPCADHGTPSPAPSPSAEDRVSAALAECCGGKDPGPRAYAFLRPSMAQQIRAAESAATARAEERIRALERERDNLLLARHEEGRVPQQPAAPVRSEAQLLADAEELADRECVRLALSDNSSRKSRAEARQLADGLAAMLAARAPEAP